MNFAFHKDAPILDTNVARLLSRYFGIPANVRSTHGRRLWELAAGVIPRGLGYVFNQALMDLGAVVCIARAPRCPACPLSNGCAWRDHSAGSLLGAPLPVPVRGSSQDQSE